MILDNHRPATVFKQQANQQDTQQVQNLDDSSQQRLEQLEQKTEAIALTFHGMWKRKSGSRIEVANHSPSFFVFSPHSAPSTVTHQEKSVQVVHGN